MSKRKAATKGQQDEGGAKKQRAAGGASSAASSSSSSADSLYTAIRRAKLGPCIAVHTLKLVDAIRPANESHTERMEALIVLLMVDADRPESLLDLSLVPPGDGLCVMWQLLRFFSSCICDRRENIYGQEDKDEAHELIYKHMLPLLPKLLRSFDPATVDAKTGNNALHQLLTLLLPDFTDGWVYEMVELLVVHGVSVHTRNKKGRTPLLTAAVGLSPAFTSAIGIRLLLSHGADLNAQDSDGDGLLHHLARGQALGVLEDLCAGGGVSHLDYALLNAVGHTAADVADFALMDAAGSGGDSETEETEGEKRAGRIRRLILTQTALWTKHSRPVLLRCLDGVLPVADLAKLVLAYVDGSGPPFAAAASANDFDDDDIDPPASASAAAAAASSS